MKMLTILIDATAESAQFSVRLGSRSLVDRYVEVDDEEISIPQGGTVYDDLGVGTDEMVLANRPVEGLAAVIDGIWRHVPGLVESMADLGLVDGGDEIVLRPASPTPAEPATP